ncbi:MAG: phosphomethylpyrimidine synthase ThiC [Dethiobacter sp.]|jgi:phosphomethylpyrimidine synthase|nr:phosphomethylpyrimidine synthase ThiC [Dethiobacter sp.]
MTQLKQARQGIITPEMIEVAEAEGIGAEALRQLIAAGEAVIPYNPARKRKAVGIGKGLATKVNANIGTSEAYPDIEKELSKLDAAVKAGADAVMDLSTGGNLNLSRQRILKHSPVMVGTVPIYQAAVEAVSQKGSMLAMTTDDLFKVIEQQAREGVDFITVHCGLTREAIGRLLKEGRVTDIVSRGGSFLTGWMLHHDKDNPLYTEYDRLLEIAGRYDVTLSLGDGLRPGCLADATDRAQIQELIVLGELVQQAWDRQVQVMVEGPGHMPMDQIEANVLIQKRLCHGAPFYVLGPLVTDIAPGYDHITSAIGGSIAAAAGADFLCYVTPAEHLGLPDLQDVKEGVIAAKIAAHAADIVKKVKGAGERDRQMALARKNLDWPAQITLSIDPERSRHYRSAKNQAGEEACTMCGRFCAMKIVSQYLGTADHRC